MSTEILMLRLRCGSIIGCLSAKCTCTWTFDGHTFRPRPRTISGACIRIAPRALGRFAAGNSAQAPPFENPAYTRVCGSFSESVTKLCARTQLIIGKTVAALGQRATEIIHIGQAVLFYRGSVEYFRDMVFNYPTLAEAYKVAALDGLNKL